MNSDYSFEPFYTVISVKLSLLMYLFVFDGMNLGQQVTFYWFKTCRLTYTLLHFLLVPFTVKYLFVADDILD